MNLNTILYFTFYLALLFPSLATATPLPKGDFLKTLSQRQSKKKMTVWIRAWGETVQPKLVPYLQKLIHDHEPWLDLQVLIATNDNDPILTDPLLQQMIEEKQVEIVLSNLHVISEPIQDLAKRTQHNTDAVILVSVGVEVQPAQAIEALGWIKCGAWAHGWQIDLMKNDGSQAGKGWYNTAVMFSPRFLHLLQDKGMPHWVDNGVEGYLDIAGQHIPIGGAEEVPMMHMALQIDPDAFFILNRRRSVHMEEKLGTGVTFEQKMLRKIAVTDFYLEKMHTSWDEISKHFFIISPDDNIE
ncbi:MAG: hypothetical protein K0S74_1752 [Chlamydiales bacterium]|jgi:hypothetical protein|nr:hypothetical protein [Chlamydiales bacterium]